MLNETPWSGLEAERVYTRRISASARWDWFWAVMPRTDVALVLQLRDLPKPAPDLPKLRSLEVQFQTLPGGPILYIRLKDSAQLELFETLCRDVMAAGELANTEAEALEAEAPDTVRFTRAIKNAVPYEHRRGVVEALWDVVLADGARAQEEDALVRMVSNLLGVSDRDSALARQAVARDA